MQLSKAQHRPSTETGSGSPRFQKGHLSPTLPGETRDWTWNLLHGSRCSTMELQFFPEVYSSKLDSYILCSNAVAVPTLFCMVGSWDVTWSWELLNQLLHEVGQITSKSSLAASRRTGTWPEPCNPSEALEKRIQDVPARSMLRITLSRTGQEETNVKSAMGISHG